MPAIQPARLRQQSALLAEHFDDPPAYLRSLHYLLEQYGDRVRRPSQSKPGPLTPAYRVSQPVLRHIIQELSPLAQGDPEKGLALCDALWEQEYLEFRLLAAMLLGQIPPDPAQIVIDRVESWLTSGLEPFLIDALLDHALKRLRQEQPQVAIQLIERWLENLDNFQKQLGLRALLPMIGDPTYENLPVLFRLIHPLTRQSPAMLRPDVLDILAALADRSPGETAFFLCQTLDFPDCRDTPWFIRQSIPSFPLEQQASLRGAVKTKEVKPQKK